MSQISVTELKTRLDSGENIQVIDIREIHEVDSGRISSTHIPMAELVDRLSEIKKDIPVVIYCKSGSRAGAMVHVLRNERELTNVMGLVGGIEAWASEIDPSIIVY